MTYFLWLLPALAVGGLGYLVRRRSAFWGQALILFACLGCLGILAWQLSENLFSSASKPPNRAHAVVSFYLANQTLRDVAGRRGSVVLIFPPKSVLDAETAESYANAFTPLFLRGHPDLDVQVARLEAPAKAAKSANPSLAAFKQVTARFPAALAFVSYAGVPADLDQLFAPEQKDAPAFYAFDPAGTTAWLSPLKQGRIRSVIVPRPGVNPAAGAGLAGPPGDIFDQLYLLATPETADQVAAQLGKK